MTEPTAGLPPLVAAHPDNPSVMIDVHGAHVAGPGSLRQPGVMQQRVYDPGRTVEHPGSEVHFPPINNGLDYLISVVEHLEAGDERVSARDLKYAVLHLAAGAEVLLKARLQHEHWSLVFKDPARALRDELVKGTLLSCSPEETVTRLRNIARVPIDAGDAAALKKLAEHRNALQHYGLIGESANARAVESKAAEVLDFLIRFLDEQLLPTLGRDAREALDVDMERIRGGLLQIRSFVKKRLQRLQGVLSEHRELTVECSNCGQWTHLVRPDPDERALLVSSCLLCGAQMLSDSAAVCYAATILGLDPWPLDGSAPATEKCPACGGSDTLVRGVRTLADPERPVAFCFQCPGEVRELPELRAPATDLAHPQASATPGQEGV
ncbi:hypothetical protein AB0E77_32860 [Streptomyces sp. NPDC032940]|uniref:hypothetical protein n=1 Tax=Streptomyces sp. NPDC032940 TaxID=3155366 RepID=UPI0033C24357